MKSFIKDDPYEMALAFQRGEEKGLSYFYNKLWKELLYYAYTKCNDYEIAKDVLEESFVKIWERHSSFNHPKTIRSWLYTTVRRDIYNRYFRNIRADKVKKEIEYLMYGEVEKPIDEGIIQAEVYGELHKQISYLPKKCRQIFKMLYIQGKTVREIAEELQLSISTIKNQKARGLMLIRKELKIN